MQSINDRVKLAEAHDTCHGPGSTAPYARPAAFVRGEVAEGTYGSWAGGGDNSNEWVLEGANKLKKSERGGNLKGGAC